MQFSKHFRRAWLIMLRLGCILVILAGLTGSSLAAPFDAAPTYLVAPEGKSTIGDYVWFDTNLDGDHLGGETEYTAGIDGVRINLYLDANLNGIIDPGEISQTMLTGDDPSTVVVETGWYDFHVDGLKQYIVEVAPSNFLPGGPLYGYFHTSEDTYGPSPLVVYLPTAIEDYNDADFGFWQNPLQLTKVLLNQSPYAAIDDTVVFRITVTNNGERTLDPVPLDDFYGPACLKYVSASVTPDAVDPVMGWLHWNNLGPLAADGSVVIDVTFTAQQTQEMYWKEGGWQDYAPKGIPDFDQRQAGWDSPPGSGAAWYRCGPVAAANSLWWFDSKYESDSQKPPAITDTYPLVASYSEEGTPTSWDDHDARNVQPLVDDLSNLMGATAGVGVNVSGLAAGITQFIADAGLANDYTVTTQRDPTYAWVAEEVRRSEDVILLLGFWQETATGAPAQRVGGHYVTVSGADLAGAVVAISDPYRDSAEAGGLGRVLPGSHADLHPVPGPAGDGVHNDAQYISQDAYKSIATSVSAGAWGLQDFVSSTAAAGCSQAANFQGLNVPSEYVDQQATCDPQGGVLWTTVEYAVAVSPKANTLMCSPTVNIAAVTGATTDTGVVLPPVQSEAPVTEGADLGDLLDPVYPTLLIHDGPRHLITSPLRLGLTVDAEADGQPDAFAAGDDTVGLMPDDEDGVTRMPGLGAGGLWADGPITVGEGGSLELTIVGGRGVPEVWMDFGAGALSKVVLRDATGASLPTSAWLPGVYRVYFDIPYGTFGGGSEIQIAVRVRLSAAGGLSATGLAPDGEIEDYLFSFAPTAVSVVQFTADSPMGAIAFGLVGIGLGVVASIIVRKRRFLERR